MIRTFIFFFSALLYGSSIVAQNRVIDATDHSPISAASIFDSAGNIVGFTWNDGEFSEIPVFAYPITLRCMGYEQLVIERPENKTWEMNPIAYELEEVVIVPVKRNILKQTFYVREYFSMNNESDTVTFFTEHMADRFVPTTKEAKMRGDKCLRILDSHHYSRYKIAGKDTIDTNPETPLPSFLTFLELNDEKVTAHESFKESESVIKLHEELGKSGMTFIHKQNDQTFTTIKDVLAMTKEHKMSPWPLKLLGFTMEFNQFYSTYTYRVNESGVYLPKDLIEASFVMQADGRGKYLRKALKSDKPIVIRFMIELYIVDRDYLSKEEAKEESKTQPTNVKFVIPSTVPPLNEATQRLVERVNKELKINNK